MRIVSSNREIIMRYEDKALLKIVFNYNDGRSETVRRVVEYYDDDSALINAAIYSLEYKKMKEQKLAKTENLHL